VVGLFSESKGPGPSFGPRLDQMPRLMGWKSVNSGTPTGVLNRRDVKGL
jgi:hypothetical protein